MKKSFSKFLVLGSLFALTTITNANAKNDSLTFFVVPGVINYAVDFNKETIYLPNSEIKTSNIDSLSKENTVAISIDKDHFNKEIIEKIILAEVGMRVDFNKLEAYRLDEKGKKIKIQI